MIIESLPRLNITAKQLATERLCNRNIINKIKNYLKAISAFLSLSQRPAYCMLVMTSRKQNELDCKIYGTAERIAFPFGNKKD